ncbi:hypothetical protein [Bradyrhizobium lablabi]|uniref:hypothetical protein n=1 Tax=Bradyrhizobium lablabi TaxID=722472 RepID=UPI001BAA0DB8|nr:hypothetical protein [Bradyrhizobium lablabi]MBR0697708.1 hypothetical protein [Bradyrhizobium lablabi]
MRVVLGLGMGLLIALGASADAATAHHSRAHHHVILPHGVASSFAAVPPPAYAWPRPSVRFHDTPSYNDPSKFGGQSLGMDP